VRAVQWPATLWKRCEDAVQSPITPCDGVYFEHAQRQPAWRLHSVLDSALWGRCEKRSGVFKSAVGKFDIFRRKYAALRGIPTAR